MRGEHALPPPADIVCTGSSPHARGARYELAPRLRRFGIIPACAGSTYQTLYEASKQMLFGPTGDGRDK